MSDPFTWQCRTRSLEVGRRPLIMGVVNITPDSFSDGGRFFDHGLAVARGLQMLEDGADIIDVGGESSRPGAEPVSEAEELRRAIPVIEALRGRTDRILSIDTAKPAVARAALKAGADLVNDITALADPNMVGVVRSYGAGLILMHMQGTPRTMQENPHYEDVVGEVFAFLEERLAVALRGGIGRERIAVDPGIGFGKTIEHNCALLRGLRQLSRLGRPIVVGVSRKRFLGELTGRKRPDERLAASIAALAASWALGGHVFRVHDAKESCDAARVVSMLLTEDGRYDAVSIHQSAESKRIA